MVRDLFARSPRRFAKAESGNVAMMWALMGAVLVGLIGITVDFTRAQALRSQMQNAADGAALVAERNSNLTMAQRTAAARAFFDAEMGQNATVVTFAVNQLPSGGHSVDAQMPMPLSLARMVRGGDWTLHVDAVAQADASPPIEVALVLDNTGSMSNDMQALRNAARDLTADLLSLDGDTVRVALVPFVAQVNIGNQQSRRVWMDTAGAAPMNGELFEDRMIAHAPRSGTSNCTTLPTAPNGYTGTYRVTWARGGGLLGGLLGGPQASGLRNRCYAWTPESGINYFTLFDLISNDSWKGCVEARPMPYDVNDAAPNPGTPETMFVPFFWIDTLDQENIPSGMGRSTSNNYLDDDQGDLPGSNIIMTTFMGDDEGSEEQEAVAHMLNPLRYRGTSASIAVDAPDARGPNRGCPTPIIPLTSTESTLQTAISGMRHWSGGGTNQAEGLAWGWRVLSPTAPFTEGVAFNQARNNVRKVIVLMSDGENTNVGDDPVMSSDYSAYNHMGFWRDFAGGGLLGQLIGNVLHGILPGVFRRNITDGTTFVTHVNERQRAVCDNIKQAGIEIYVVRFRSGDESVMRYCASGNDHFFNANNAQQLSEAFDAIGTGIGSLRLTH